MPQVGFEPTIPATNRTRPTPQTVATVTGPRLTSFTKINSATRMSIYQPFHLNFWVCCHYGAYMHSESESISLHDLPHTSFDET
jgi:hypothetical protein